MNDNIPTLYFRTPVERAEIHTYGCTMVQMKEAVQQGLDSGRHKTGIDFAKSLIGDALEEMATYDTHDARQTLNRALFVLSNYC